MQKKLSPEQRYIQDVLGVHSIIRPEVAEASHPEVAASQAKYELAFFVEPNKGPAVEALLSKIIGAVNYSVEVIEVKEVEKALSTFAESSTAKAIIFGESLFLKMGGQEGQFFDYFSRSFSVIEGKSFYVTHDLVDLCEGPEQQVNNLKRQTWGQLKKLGPV